MRIERRGRTWRRFLPTEDEKRWILANRETIGTAAIAKTLNVSGAWVQVFLRKHGCSRRVGRPTTAAIPAKPPRQKAVGLRGRCICGGDHAPVYYEPVPGTVKPCCARRGDKAA